MAGFLNGRHGLHAAKLAEEDLQSEPVRAPIHLPPRLVSHVMEVHLKQKTATLKAARVSYFVANFILETCVSRDLRGSEWDKTNKKKCLRDIPDNPTGEQAIF